MTTLILAAWLALAAGWALGYTTRRLVQPAPGTAAQDAAALDAEARIADERARFDAMIANLDVPKEPK